MLRLFVRVTVCALVAAGVMGAVQAGASPLSPGAYRIVSVGYPGFAMAADEIDEPGPISVVAASELDVWELVVIDYRSGGPIYQIRNAISRWCLRPRDYRPAGFVVEQGPCGVSDYETWSLTDTGGRRYLTVAADPRLRVSARCSGGTVVAEPVGNDPRAQWLLQPAAESQARS